MFHVKEMIIDDGDGKMIMMIIAINDIPHWHYSQCECIQVDFHVISHRGYTKQTRKREEEARKFRPMF